VYGSFFPASMRHPVPVEAEPRVPPLGRPLTASLFTRGIDSWFAVLSAMEDPSLRPAISHVVYLPAGPERWTDQERRADPVCCGACCRAPRRRPGSGGRLWPAVQRLAPAARDRLARWRGLRSPRPSRASAAATS
jgi:hypothetical protein